MRMATPDPLPCGAKYTQYSRKGLTFHLARSLLLRQDGRRLRLAYSETGGHAAASKSNGPPSIRPAPPKHRIPTVESAHKVYSQGTRLPTKRQPLQWADGCYGSCQRPTSSCQRPTSSCQRPTSSCQRPT